MGRTRKKPVEVNKSQWFRDYFNQNPDDARNANLDNVIKNWETANPSIPWDRKVAQSMHAARSKVRLGMGIKGRKRRKKKKDAPAAAKASPAATKRSSPTGVLKDLESRLDDCIFAVLKNDNEGLKPIVDSLRQARLAVLKTMIGV